MAFLDMLTSTDAAAALAAGAFLATAQLLTWGARTLAGTLSARELRHRRLSTAGALVALGAIALCLALVAPGTPGRAVAGVLAALAIIAHAARDPSRSGLWHHRRLRPAWTLGLVAASLALAVYLPAPVLAPTLLSVVVARRHQRGLARMHADALRELADLRIRQLRLVTDALQLRQVEPLPQAQADGPGGRRGADMRRDNWPAAG
jgi:hypothetical protein